MQRRGHLIALGDGIYTVSEVSRILRPTMTPRKVRYWLRKGILGPPVRPTRSGRPTRSKRGGRHGQTECLLTEGCVRQSPKQKTSCGQQAYHRVSHKRGPEPRRIPAQVEGRCLGCRHRPGTVRTRQAADCWHDLDDGAVARGGPKAIPVSSPSTLRWLASYTHRWPGAACGLDTLPGHVAGGVAFCLTK